MDDFPWINQPCNALGQSLFGTGAVTATKTAPVATVTTGIATTVANGIAVSVPVAATITAVIAATVPTYEAATDATDATDATNAFDVTAGIAANATVASGNVVTVPTIVSNEVAKEVVNAFDVTEAIVAIDANDVFVANTDEVELNSIDGLNITDPRGNDSHWLEYSTLMGNTLPLKSKLTYLKSYSELETYLKRENQFVAGVIPSEHAILNYFHFLKNVRHLAPTTIWYI